MGKNVIAQNSQDCDAPCLIKWLPVSYDARQTGEGALQALGVLLQSFQLGFDMEEVCGSVLSGAWYVGSTRVIRGRLWLSRQLQRCYQEPYVTTMIDP